MDLAALQTFLTSWVETASGLEVEWGRLPQKAHDGPFALAYMGAISKVGHDERIQTYDSGSDSTTVQVIGVRELPFRLSFRSFDQNLGGSARQYAEQWRARAHSQESLDNLATAGVALVDTDPLFETDYTWSNRTVSQVDTTANLAIRASFADDLHDGSFIDDVNIDTQPYIVDEFGIPVLDETRRILTRE